LSGVGGVERPGIVHRLDKDTSGVLLVAKTDAAHRGLAEQFAGRHLRKEYLALVSGVPSLLAGVIDRAISRHPVHPPSHDRGRGWPAVAHRLGTGRGFRAARSVAALPHSHRPHTPDRVHLKSIGPYLLGDTVYGWKPDPRLPLQPSRVMLHAERIAFLHPVTGQAMDLHAPLPEDFRRCSML